MTQAPRVGRTISDVSEVRPYVVTEGRVRGPLDVHVDTLLHQRVPIPAAPRAMSTEERAILHQVGDDFVTVAEVSAHLRMPLGVTQVLVGDLATAGALTLQDTAADAMGSEASAAGRHAAFDLLQEVSHGIARL